MYHHRGRISNRSKEYQSKFREGLEIEFYDKFGKDLKPFCLVSLYLAPLTVNNTLYQETVKYLLRRFFRNIPNVYMKNLDYLIETFMMTTRIQAHHIKPLDTLINQGKPARNETNNQTNGILLCAGLHDLFHDLVDNQYASQVLQNLTIYIYTAFVRIFKRLDNIDDLLLDSIDLDDYCKLLYEENHIENNDDVFLNSIKQISKEDFKNYIKMFKVMKKKLDESSPNGDFLTDWGKYLCSKGLLKRSIVDRLSSNSSNSSNRRG